MSDELQEAVAVIGHDWATFCVCLLCSIGFLLGFYQRVCISHWGFPLFFPWIVLGSTLIIVCRCVLILSLICVFFGYSSGMYRESYHTFADA